MISITRTIQTDQIPVTNTLIFIHLTFTQKKNDKELYTSTDANKMLLFFKRGILNRSQLSSHVSDYIH